MTHGPKKGADHWQLNGEPLYPSGEDTKELTFDTSGPHTLRAVCGPYDSGKTYTIYANDCVDTCPGCYECVDGSCEACKCWDDGGEINGSITVQDAKLCEVVIHTSSISDTDHWFLGGDGEGNPTDTISSYTWSKTAGDNPETGTFTGATDEATVTWQAPPCTGTVIIKLDADDEPDSMDNPCPDSDRDDPNEVFEGTSTVSLPDGCYNAGPHDSSVHWDDDQDYYSEVYWGACITDEATYDVDFKYSNCDWVCEISNVVAKTLVLVGGPPRTNYVAITQASDVPCTPSSEPLLAKTDLTDPDLNDDEGPPLTKYWMHHANIAHELKHRSDWKGFYELRLNETIDWCELLYRDIDCGDPTASTCQGAKGFWQSSIEEAFQDAWDFTCVDYDDPGTSFKECEQRAYLVQNEVQQPVADALPEGCGN